MQFVIWHFLLQAALLPSPNATLLNLSLLPAAQVDASGIFLADIVAASAAATLPRVRLADPPTFGQAKFLTRAELTTLLGDNALAFATTEWTGADKVRITRRARPLHETEAKVMLTEALQRDHVGDRGELEIRFTRPWRSVMVPDDSLEVIVIDLPASGISPHFVARFELRSGQEIIGPWQVPIQARIYREAWIARSPLKPGQLMSDLELVRERRDVLATREMPLSTSASLHDVELAETIPAGGPITMRSVRLRPIIRRGQVLEAEIRDGPMIISLKVEALENGARGQFVRVRNVYSRKELRGKVEDEDTILVSL